MSYKAYTNMRQKYKRRGVSEPYPSHIVVCSLLTNLPFHWQCAIGS